MFVLGLGCSEDGVTFIRWSALVRSAVGKSADAEVRCDRSLGRTLHTVARRTCALPPRRDSLFVAGIVDDVRSALDHGPVHLAGHSYGGAVVSMVADILRADPNVHRLRCATFGAIYTPSVDEVDLVHYMLRRDVALLCNHVPLDSREADDVGVGARSIYWLDHDEPGGGIPLRVDIHQSYKPMVAAFFRELPRDVRAWTPRKTNNGIHHRQKRV